MKKILQGGALLVLAGLITGCGTSGHYSDSAGNSASYDRNRPDAGDQYASSEEGDFSPDFEDLAERAAETQRQIIITGNLYATAADPFKAADDVLNVVTKAGGFAEDRSQSGKVEDGTASVSLKVRIPAGKATETIEDVESAVDVYELSTNKEDVTAHVADVEARIAALETSVERLTGLVSEATSSEALFEAEEALTRRQGELDSLRAVQRSLADQVSLATLNISIDSEEVYTSPPEGFMGGLTSGWDSLVAAFLTALTVIGAIVPWLIVIVPIAAIIAWLVRRIKRRRVRYPARSTVEPSAGAPAQAVGPGEGPDVGKVDQEVNE